MAGVREVTSFGSQGTSGGGPVEQMPEDLNNKIVVQVQADLPAKSGGQVAEGGIESYPPAITLKDERNSAGNLNSSCPTGEKGVHSMDTLAAKGVSGEHVPEGVTSVVTPSRLARSLTVAPVPLPVEGVTNRSPLAGDVGNADPIPEREDAKDTPFQGDPAKDGADRPSPAEIMARCVRETGFSAREIRKPAVEGLLHHYAERGEFTLPLTFAPPRRERENAGPPAAPPPPPSGNDGSGDAAPEPEDDGWIPQGDGTAIYDMTDKLPPEEYERYVREADALGITPTEHFTALARKGRARIKEAAEEAGVDPGELVAGLVRRDAAKTEDAEPEPETVSVLIHREKRALLERHAATLGCDAGKLAAVLVEIETDRELAAELEPEADGGERLAWYDAEAERLRLRPMALFRRLPPESRARLLEEAEESGLSLEAVVTIETREAIQERVAALTAPRHAPGFGITAKQARRLRRLAKLLEVTPREFLRWQVNDQLDQLEDPSTGNLAGWARDMIPWEDEASYERVPARVEAWLERRRERLERRAA